MPETEGRWVERIQPERQRGDGCRGLNPVTPQVNQRRNYREESSLITEKNPIIQQYLRQASRCARRSIAAAQTERRHARQRGMGQYPWGSLVLRESSSHSNFQLRFVLRPKAAPPSRCHKYNGFQSSILDNGFQSSVLDNGL